jgi:hypothetical protein
MLIAICFIAAGFIVVSSLLAAAGVEHIAQLSSL